MIDLSQRTEPYELELPYGLCVTVLLPAAEAGLVEALCSDRVRNDGP